MTRDTPRCARRVLPRLRPGRRRVRPSRASPARLRSAPARLRRAYAIPRAPRLAWPVLRPPFGRARATPAATWSAMSTGLDTATRFPSSGASRRRCHPRATVMGNANGHRPLPPDPALLTEVAGQLPRQRPQRNAAKRRLHLLCPCPASPNPGGASAGSAAKRLPRCRASLDLPQSLTGTLHAPAHRLPGHRQANTPGRRPGSKSCGRRPHATPPTGGSLPRARKRRRMREIGVRAYARTLAESAMPTRHPVDPGGMPSVPSSKLGKQTPHAAPREAARCRHVSHAARIAAPCPLADKPAVLSAVSACRRSSDRSPPTALVQTPACRPPKGKPAVKSRMPSS